MTIKVADLFAGVGGLSYGFSHNKNFEIVFANEFERDIAEAYKLNHPKVNMINCDIKELDEQKISSFCKDRIDLIVGGPPCQSYSTLGKRQMDDRANLFLEYCRILKILKPKVFVFENVTGLLSMDNGKLFPKIREKFKEIGYSLVYKVLNAADYGVPQFRERIILVGVFGQKNDFVFPNPTHGKGLKPFVTVADALNDLPQLASGEAGFSYLHNPSNEFQEFVRYNAPIKILDHIAPKNNPDLIRLMKLLPDGGDKSNLPLKLRPKSGYGNTYAKLWWNKPATTITRNFACPSSSRCIHPRDSRALTTREGARLQSFPDSYLFYGSRSTKNLEIGNAVPPLLSMAIARQISKLFKK